LAEDWDMTKRAARHGALTIVRTARVRHEHSSKNRSDLSTIVRLRRANFLYIYKKLNADRNPLNRLCKQWFLFGEALRGLKHKVSGEASPFSG
jgi:GT2 family glycosyltransferase